MSSTGEEGQQLLELSDLPDEILMRILTLLPTEDAVRTCLLLFRRTEQKHLWKYLPCLKFHFYVVFLKRESPSINFVERVMHLREPSVPLASFSLICEIGSHNVDRVKTWITEAVQFNLEQLTLSIFDYGSKHRIAFIPSCIFKCQSLVKLDLEYFTFEVPSSVICLPLLKYLRLYQVILLPKDDSIEKLLSSPLLEELIIHQCSYFSTPIHVCSPKLQILNICDSARYGCSTKICIVGDNLKYFSYTGILNNENRICASTQLTKVEIYVDQQMVGDLSLNCYAIVKGLYGTRYLAVSDYFLEGLLNIPELLDTIPLFECVTRLDIQAYKKICIDSWVLIEVYEKCPHLKYLNIGKLSQSERSSQLSPIPLCFQTSLKKIIVHYYVPGDDEADAAIDVLLNSAFVLEELVIYCNCDKDGGFHESGPKIQELHDRFNQRPRVSKDCIISVKVKYVNDSYLRSREYEDCYLKSMNES